VEARELRRRSREIEEGADQESQLRESEREGMMMNIDDDYSSSEEGGGGCGVSGVCRGAWCCSQVTPDCTRTIPLPSHQ